MGRLTVMPCLACNAECLTGAAASGSAHPAPMVRGSSTTLRSTTLGLALAD